MKAWNKKHKPKYQRKYSKIIYFVDNESNIYKKQYIIKNYKIFEERELNCGTVLEKEINEKDVIM